MTIICCPAEDCSITIVAGWEYLSKIAEFSTEIAANFVEIDNGLDSVSQPEIRQPTPRELFKRRLHGMINVRTDGKQIYAARRVAAGYMSEYYGTHPEDRSILQ